MKHIEVTDEIFELLNLFTEKEKTYSQIIRWWHDEVFNTRRSSIRDSDFGRSMP